MELPDPEEPFQPKIEEKREPDDALSEIGGVEQALNSNERAWKSYQKGSQSKETQDFYHLWLGNWQRWRQKLKLGREICDNDIEQFKTYIMMERTVKVGANKAQIILSVLSKYYSFMLPGNKIRFRLIKGKQQIIRPHHAYTIDEIKAIF